MLNYLLRDIDPDLWAKVKDRAKGSTLRSVILQLLKQYVQTEAERIK